MIKFAARLLRPEFRIRRNDHVLVRRTSGSKPGDVSLVSDNSISSVIGRGRLQVKFKYFEIKCHCSIHHRKEFRPLDFFCGCGNSKFVVLGVLRHHDPRPGPSAEGSYCHDVYRFLGWPSRAPKHWPLHPFYHRLGTIWSRSQQFSPRDVRCPPPACHHSWTSFTCGARVLRFSKISSLRRHRPRNANAIR